MLIQFKPTERQLEGAQFLVRRKEAILAYKTGGGKSCISMLVAFKLLKVGEVDKVMFVCTKSSFIEILNEFEKRTDVKPVKIDTVDQFIDFSNGDSSICLVQYNILQRMCGDKGQDFFGGMGLDRVKMVFRSKRYCVILDEVHKLKNPKSSMTRTLSRLRSSFNRVYGVTATLVSGNIYDLYNIIRFISPSLLGSYSSFTNLYVNIREKEIWVGGRKVKIKEVESLKNLDHMNKVISEVVIRDVSESDISFDKKEADLTLKEEYWLAAKGVIDDYTRAQYSSRLVHLQRIVDKDPAKLNLFMGEISRVREEGALVFCSFYTSLEFVASVLKNNSVEYRVISGKESSDKRRENKEWFISSPKGKVLLLTLAGGQCFAKGTGILMFSGEVKRVEDIQVGDLVMGPDSGPRKVESLARGRGNLYQVNPVRGKPYTVNESHILSLKYAGGHRDLKGKIENIGVKEYLSRGRWFKDKAMGWKTGVDFQEKKLEVPPYILGIWLGDGCQYSATVYCGKKEPEIYNEWVSYGRSLGLKIKERDQPGCNKVTITTGLVGLKTTNPFQEFLNKRNLVRNKHIPFDYKTGSREQRLELLAGIIDTDGCIHSSCGYEVSQSRKNLVDEIEYLAQSLGYSARVRKVVHRYTKESPEKTLYKISISGEVSEIPCRVKRKLALKRRDPRDVLMSPIRVEFLEEGEFYGFEVSGPDKLFLLSDFTVTHNSLNLQATPHVIFWDIPFGVGHFIQVCGRVVREFSKFKSFRITFLILKETIDEYKYELIAQNKEIFKRVLSNEIIPEGRLVDSISGTIIGRLKKRFLWKGGK